MATTASLKFSRRRNPCSVPMATLADRQPAAAAGWAIWQELPMEQRHGFRRLENFSDAVVAIAITLLILPWSIRPAPSDPGTGPFVHHHGAQFLAFGPASPSSGVLWGQHQALERVTGYDRLLITGMFVWILSIVFLPFPHRAPECGHQGRRGGARALRRHDAHHLRGCAAAAAIDRAPPRAHRGGAPAVRRT